MKQVFVFSEHAPLGQDLAGLLHPEADLNALGWETDLDRAIRRIKKIQPPAVIVAAPDATTDSGPAVARLRAECLGIQIVEVNLEARVLRIYGGELQMVQELGDLISTIEGFDAAASRQNLSN